MGSLTKGLIGKEDLAVSSGSSDLTFTRLASSGSTLTLTKFPDIWGSLTTFSTSGIISLTEDTAPTSDDLLITVNAPGGTPALKKVTIANLFANAPEVNITSGSLKIAGTQVVGARVVDIRSDDTIPQNTTYCASTAGVIAALRDAMVAHGLISAS